MLNQLIATLRRRLRRSIPVLALAVLAAAALGACFSDEESWQGLSEDEQYAYAGNCSSCKGGATGKGNCSSAACPSGQWCDSGFCDCCCDNTKPTGGQATFRSYKYGSCTADCSTLDNTACPNKSGGLCWVTGGDDDGNAANGKGCEKLSDPNGTLGLSPTPPYRICNCEVTCNASLPGNSTEYEGCGKPGTGKCPALVCPGTTKVKNCTLAAENCTTPTPTPTSSVTPSPTVTPTATPSPTPTATATPSPTASASPGATP